jgi:hypothetical protein
MTNARTSEVHLSRNSSKKGSDSLLTFLPSGGGVLKVPQ